MKPVVIHTRCRGNRVCEEIAPEAFGVDDTGMAWVLDDDPPPAQYAAVRDAALRCPAKAILVDDA